MINYAPLLEKLGLQTSPCPVYFTKKHLHFWEGGAFLEENGVCWIEINSSPFLSFLGYRPEMILLHEWIHAIRLSYGESKWEELIAYQVSKRAYQRFLGPLFSKKTFLSVLGLVILTRPLPWVFLASLLLMAGFFLRYLKDWRQLNKIKGLLNTTYGKEKAFCHLIRLSPKALDELAKKPAPGVGDL